MRTMSLGLLIAAALGSFSTVHALPPFKPVFQEKYVKPETPIEAAFKTGSCAMCHVKGGKRVPQNPYGEELNKLIPGNAKERLEAAKKLGDAQEEAEEAKLIEELQAAFSKVEKLHTDPKDPNSPTWGDRLQDHLPPIDPEKNKPQTEE